MKVKQATPVKTLHINNIYTFQKYIYIYLEFPLTLPAKL